MGIVYLFCKEIFLVVILFSFFSVGNAHAATLGNVSDRISTSRPSASAPLQAAQAASASQVTITDLNDNVIFLASDSAVLFSDTGQTLDTVTIASASAADTPASNQRLVFFTGTATNTHHTGTPIITAISAMHEITFINPATIPSSGDIELYFPALSSGDANNPASPSASTFQFNGLADATIEIWDDGGEISPTITVTNPTSGTQPRITFDLAAAISANSTIKIFLGCTVSTSTACTTVSPRMVNPTQSSTALGTARIWTVRIDTEDSNDVGIDSARISIGTVDSVLVQGTVDPSLTVTIAGVNTATNLNATSGCASETTNSGVNSTATSVNLGNLANGVISLAAQTITVSTNAQFGYVITATSSGRFLNPSNGFWITDVTGGNGLTANDTPAPAEPPATGSPFFGLFPCGARPPTASPDYDDENTIAFDVATSARGVNPWQSGVTGFYATIASYAGPGISSDATALRYASSIAATTGAGTFFTVFTYVVTPTF